VDATLTRNHSNELDLCGGIRVVAVKYCVEDEQD
jgi:hypothetical protein